MPDLFDGWTKDAAGKYVDWTKPPYYVKGVIMFKLPGENSISFETLGKRSQEYMKLTLRKMACKKENGPRRETLDR